MSKNSKGVALVTGASAGIGALYAERLAQRGYDLLLVARNAERLDALARRIAAETGRSVETLAADLGREDSLMQVENRLSSDTSITMLVNNAGVGSATPLLASDREAMSRMIALNVEALMRLTYAAVPGFVERGGGTIVNMASIVAIAPEILNGVYGGTKAFVLAFTRSLHHELAGRGLRVQAVLPGAVGTDFWDVAGTSVSELPAHIVMSPQDAVEGALAGLDQGELITLPSVSDVTLIESWEEARDALIPFLSRDELAPRYRAHGA